MPRLFPRSTASAVATLAMLASATWLMTTTASASDAEPPTGTRLTGPNAPCGSLNRRIITREDLERTGQMQLSAAIARSAGSPGTAAAECRERAKPDAADDAATG